MSSPSERPAENSGERRGGPEAREIRSMFSRIAGRYDLTNTVLSMGVHHLWRRRAVRFAGAKAGDRVLDCATGTGDLAIAFAKAVAPGGEVIGTDFCPEMLAPAPAKAAREGVKVRFQEADVTALPFEADRFDIASIAFGIRNVEDRAAAFKELARVTRPGGRVLILEFGQPSAPGLAGLYNAYSRHVLPRIGGWLTGDRSAYGYLEKSSAAFPCGEAFVAEMEASGGYASVEVEPLSLGVAYLYRGTVRPTQ